MACLGTQRHRKRWTYEVRIWGRCSHYVPLLLPGEEISAIGHRAYPFEPIELRLEDKH